MCKVLDGDIHVLKLCAEFFPFVVSECGEIKIDELGAELGELVVEAHGVVAALGAVLLVLGAGFPGVRVDHFLGWVTHRESYGAVTSFQYLVRHI